MNDSYEKAKDLWRGFDIETSKDLEAYLENFSVLFAYNSGVIENLEIHYEITKGTYDEHR